MMLHRAEQYLNGCMIKEGNIYFIIIKVIYLIPIKDHISVYTITLTDGIENVHNVDRW